MDGYSYDVFAAIPQTQNRYPYVVNNPANLLDPTGASAESYYESLGVPPPPELNCASGDIPCALAWSADLVAYHYNVLLPALMERIKAAMETVMETAARFATVDCLTFAVGTAGLSFGIQGQIGAMLISQTICGAAGDEAGALGELGSILGPELSGDYTKAFLKHNKTWGSVYGGSIPEAAATVDAVRVGGNALAWGVSFYQCGRSAGVW